MAYAVFESGGKQYFAREGQSVDVDKIKIDVGSELIFDQVLLTSQDGSVQVGQPVVKNAQVKATVVGQVRGPKILVFKYKPKIRYRRRQGHRQHYTRVLIDEIIYPGGEKAAPKKAESKPEAPVEPKEKAEKPAKAAEKQISLEDIDLNSMLKAELEELAEELGVMPEEGSGAGGNVLVKDLQEAIRKELEK
ncbi:MAG: 50S ribosomal protein L21 [Anaerolineales bacterium]